MKLKHLIILGLIAFFAPLTALALNSPSQANINSPSQWIINSPSSTITPNPNTLQVPCANIVGGCSGGGGASSTPAGSSTQVQYNLNGALAATSTFSFSNTSGLLIQNLDTTRYADQYTGVDMAAKVNAAETALCAATGGGTIVVPAGQFASTNNIVIAGCATKLIGAAGGGFYAAGGTTLLYNGTTTAFTYNVAGYSSAGVGIFDMSLVGPAGIAHIGSSNIASSYGIKAGGSNGEFGFNIQGVQVSGFGTALYIDSNASFLNMTNSVLQKNGRDIDSPQLSGANGENMRVSNSIIADCNSPTGSISSNCVVVQESGNVQWTFENVSFDDAAIVSNQFGGTANIWNFISIHDEDPNTGQTCYTRISTQASFAGAAATVINVIGGDFMEDKTSGACNEFITYGGTLVLTNVTGDINNNVTSPMTDFATPLNSQATISWSGLSNKGFNTNNSLNTGFTNVYSSFAYSVDGLGYGTSAPAFSISTSSQQFSNLQDAQGNKFSTSTASAGVATTTPFTAGCLPLASTSLALTNSAICQTNNVSTTVTTPTSTITFDNSGSSFQNSVTSSTISFTTAGTNRMLFVAVTGDITNDRITGATYNGVAMTLDGKVNTPSDRWFYLFSLINPAVGTNNIVVSASGVTAIATADVSYDNVNQSGQPEVINSGTATSVTTITATSTTLTPNDFMLVGVDGPSGATGNATSTNRQANGALQIFDTTSSLGTVGTYGIKLTGSSSGWGWVAVAFAPTPAVTTSTITSSVGVSSQYYSAYFKNATTTAVSSTAINWNNGNVQSLVLASNTTLTFTNVQSGGRYLLMLGQDATGTRTVTWPSSIQWAGGIAPALTTALGKMDLITFVCASVSSSDCYGGANLNYSP